MDNQVDMGLLGGRSVSESASSAAETIKVAQDLNKSRLDLINPLAKRQQQIHVLVGKLAEEQAAYEREYQKALRAWDQGDLDKMRLAKPDHVITRPKTAKTQPAAKKDNQAASAKPS